MYEDLALDLMLRLKAMNFSTNHFGENGEWEIIGYGLHTPTAQRTGVVPVKMEALRVLIEHTESLTRRLALRRGPSMEIELG